MKFQLFREMVTTAGIAACLAIIGSAPGFAQAFDPRSWSVDVESGTVAPPSAQLRERTDAAVQSRAYHVEPKRVVAFAEDVPAGSLIISTRERTLHYVLGNGRAIRYAVGVGRDGFAWSGDDRISAKRQWPDWHPPEEMRVREAAKGRVLPVKVEGGPNNPLGARALYIGNTLYRVHGTNEPWTVGSANSSGCIRMTNDDVIDLYKRVEVGARVMVRH